MHTTARNSSGRCVMAAPTSNPEFEPPKIASLPGSGVPRFNQPFRSRQEIIECNLPVPPFGRLVPLGSEFRTSANIWQREQATPFHQKSDEHAELRCHRHAIATVRGHDCGM